MDNSNDEEDDMFKGTYEDGFWIWCEEDNQLKMIYHETSLTESLTKSVINLATGKIEFKNDIDVIDQIRFKNRYQRKVKISEPDVIALQDVKNLALYMAPVAILTVQTINMLHTTTAERLIRALILYCQYFIQVKESIDKVNSEVLKLKSTQTYEKERRFQEDLSDLRALVANEYCTVISGAKAEVRKFHHKGPLMNQRSLGHKDLVFFEVLIRFIIQIVWLSLGRSNFTLVEVEITRIFKSYHYNVVEHVKQTKFLTSMTKSDQKVLTGENVQVHTQKQKLRTRSPLLMDALFVKGKDFRHFGLGTISHSGLSPRLDYFKKAICLPEEELMDKKISLGILGMERSKFDTMLKVIPLKIESSSAVRSRGGLPSVISRKSQGGTRIFGDSEKSITKGKLLQEVILPPREPKGYFSIPPDFPEVAKVSPFRFKEQIVLWYMRRDRLLKKRHRDL